MADLTDLQQRFVEEYLGEAGFNATAAAERAGYKGSRNTLAAVGSENLRKPKIKKAIEKRLEELSMSAAEATKRMTEIARSDMGEFFTIEEDEEGEEYARLDLVRLIEKGPSHLVKELKWTKHGPQIKSYDKQAALKTILDAHGAFNHTQKQEISGKDGGPVQHQWGPPRDIDEGDDE